MRRTYQRLAVAALAAGLLLLAVLAGALLLTGDGEAARVPVAPPLHTPAPRAVATATPAATAKPRAARIRRAPKPVRISIPAIGVNARIIRLGLDRTGALEVPRNFAETGWWSGGARPGERGPAVIAGHVDSYTGPAVFFRLGELRRGDEITIERADGTRVRFHAQRAARYSKTRFPTKEVYGPTARPTLRLITCSGTFDRSSGHYLDNTVVYAR